MSNMKRQNFGGGVAVDIAALNDPEMIIVKEAEVVLSFPNFAL
jgi:hypothetical protein